MRQENKYNQKPTRVNRATETGRNNYERKMTIPTHCTESKPVLSIHSIPGNASKNTDMTTTRDKQKPNACMMM